MKLHYKSYGDGPPVIILHGLFGMLDNWQTFARNLSEEYSVFTLDLRNHGRSPHNDVFNYHVLADDIIEFMEEHQLGQVALIGHSLGGKVAMQTALSHADLVRKLMVVDIAPRAYRGGHDTIIDALQSMDLSKMRSRSQIEDALIVQLNDEGVVRFLSKNVARHEDGSFFWRMNLPVLDVTYANTTAAIESSIPFAAPTLFVRGGRSRYLLDEDWPEILKLFPSAELMTIEDAGHWVHADAMEALLKVTREFLAEGKVPRLRSE